MRTTPLGSTIIFTNLSTFLGLSSFEDKYKMRRRIDSDLIIRLDKRSLLLLFIDVFRSTKK